MFRNINFLRSSKIFLAVLTLWVSWHGGIGIDSAFAQAPDPTTAPDSLIRFFADLATLLIGIINVFMWLLFMILDRIMNPDFIFDMASDTGTPNMSLTNMLQSIWQLCRDLINLFMALALIAGAVQMIVTADASKLKEQLPKFVMALILVNFSWFIPRAIFDLSNVLTHTVYQVPSLLGAEGCILPATDTQPARPCEVAVNYAFFDQANTIREGVNGWSCPVPGIMCIQFVPIGSPFAPTQNMHSQVINGLVVNHARLRTLIHVVNPPIGNPTFAPLMYLIKIMLILAIHAVMFFPILALTVAFFIRIPVLWVTMAFMPLAALSYVFPQEWLGDMDPKAKIMGEFLKVVFLPVKVAIPFTIGFVMINAASQTPAPSMFAQVPPIAVFSGVSSLWQIIWMVVSMGIIWKYSFEALKSGGELVNKFTDKIQSTGQATMDLAYKAPMSVPFIPMAGGRRSLMDVGRAFSPQAALNDIAMGTTPRSPFNRLATPGPVVAPPTALPDSIKRAEAFAKANAALLLPLGASLRSATTAAPGKPREEFLTKTFETIVKADPGGLGAVGRREALLGLLEQAAALGLTAAEVKLLRTIIT